jgi:competence protein ComEC
LSRISAAGIRVLRTDRDGDVAVVDTGHGLAVARRGPPPGRQPPADRALPPAVTRRAGRSSRRRRCRRAGPSVGGASVAGCAGEVAGGCDAPISPLGPAVRIRAGRRRARMGR